MKQDKGLELRSRCKWRLNEIMADVISAGHTAQHAEYERARVLSDLPPATPNYVKAWLDGYWQARVEELFTRELVYGGWWFPAPADLAGRRVLQAAARHTLATDATSVSELRPRLFVTTHVSREDYYERLGLTADAFKAGGVVTGKGHYWPPQDDREPKPWIVDDKDPENSRPWPVHD